MQLIEHVLKGGHMDGHKNTMKVYYGSIDSYHANKSAHNVGEHKKSGIHHNQEQFMFSCYNIVS